MSLQAYKTAATRAESPREMEYRLFGQVTRALMHASTVDKLDIATRIDAIDWNRRLWSTLSTSCSDSTNAMPQALRAHPTEDHFLPLFFALGAAGDAARPTYISREVMYGMLAMDSFSLE